jgi:hypothetical protein
LTLDNATEIDNYIKLMMAGVNEAQRSDRMELPKNK